MLLGQMICSAVIDQFGLLGAIQNSLSPRRLAGLALMMVGIVLAQR
ncbi:MAG: DMT family transporter [Paracoccaceae bacterium]